jgi:hypothetical protein
MLFASFGTFFSLIAFVFDIIAFSIAKSRIEKAQSSVSVVGVQGNVDTGASLGNAVWMTLAAFICLLTSGCFFCIGRTVIRGRGDEGWRKKDRKRERERDQYASQMREDAIEAEKVISSLRDLILVIDLRNTYSETKSGWLFVCLTTVHHTK